MKRKKRHKRRKTAGTKGKLVHGFIENISVDAFEVIPDQLKRHLEKRGGIYALYRNDELHYIGMSENLFGRIHHHTTDRHAKRWNYFSAYVIGRFRYIKDLEAIVLRLGQRRGNKVVGNFPRSRNIRRKIAGAIKQRRRQIDGIFA